MKKKKLLPIGIAACIAVGSFSLPSAFGCEYAVASVNDVFDFNDVIFDNLLKKVYRCIGIPIYTSPFGHYHMNNAASSFIAALAAVQSLVFHDKDGVPASGVSDDNSLASASDDKQGTSGNLSGGTGSGSNNNEYASVSAYTSPYYTVTYWDVFYPAEVGNVVSDKTRIPLKKQNISNNKNTNLSEVTAAAEKPGEKDSNSGVIPKEDKPSKDTVKDNVSEDKDNDVDEKPEEDNTTVEPSVPEDDPSVITPEDHATPYKRSYFADVYDNSSSIEYTDSEGNGVCSVFIYGSQDTYDEDGTLILSEGQELKGMIEIKNHLNGESVTFMPGEIDDYHDYVSEMFEFDVYMDSAKRGASYPRYIEEVDYNQLGWFINSETGEEVCSVIKHGVIERYDASGEVISREGEELEGIVEIKNLITGEVFTFPDGGNLQDYYGFVWKMCGGGAYYLSTVRDAAHALPYDVIQSFENIQFYDSDDLPVCDVNIYGATKYYDGEDFLYEKNDLKGFIEIIDSYTEEKYSFSPGELDDYKAFVRGLYGEDVRIYYSTEWDELLGLNNDDEDDGSDEDSTYDFEVYNQYYYIDSDDNLVCWVKEHLKTSTFEDGLEIAVDDSNAGALEIYIVPDKTRFSFAPGELEDLDSFVKEMFDGDAYLTKFVEGEGEEDSSQEGMSEVQHYTEYIYASKTGIMNCSAFLYGPRDIYINDEIVAVEDDLVGYIRIENYDTNEVLIFEPGDFKNADELNAYVFAMFEDGETLVSKNINDDYGTSYFEEEDTGSLPDEDPRYEEGEDYDEEYEDDIFRTFTYEDSDGSLLCNVIVYDATEVYKNNELVEVIYDKAGVVEIYDVINGKVYTFEPGELDDFEEFNAYVMEMYNGEAILVDNEEDTD